VYLLKWYVLTKNQSCSLDYIGIIFIFLDVNAMPLGFNNASRKQLRLERSEVVFNAENMPKIRKKRFW
jgi:hypothetical protein